MSDIKYNGWTNYETWLASLWLDGMEDTAQEYYDSARADGSFSKEEKAACELAEYLEEYVNELHKGEVSKSVGLINDLIASSISAINFNEIAKNMIDACDKEQAEEEEEICK